MRFRIDFSQRTFLFGNSSVGTTRATAGEEAKGARRRESEFSKLEETGFTPIFDGTTMTGLGLRSRLLACGEWRDHRRDAAGSSTEAEYFLHLERRAARRFRIEAAIQADRCKMATAVFSIEVWRYRRWRSGC